MWWTIGVADMTIRPLKGGRKREESFKTGEVLNGVFVFPSVQPGTSHLSFHDADQGIVIRDISLSRDTR